MLLKMNRTQKTEIGTLRMGVAYSFDMAKPAHARVANSLLERKMAEKTTKAAIDKALEDDAAKQAAALADGADGRTGTSAIGEALAVKAAEEAEAKAKAEAEAKAAAEAAEKAAAAGGEANNKASPGKKAAAK